MLFLFFSQKNKIFTTNQFMQLELVNHYSHPTTVLNQNKRKHMLSLTAEHVRTYSTRFEVNLSIQSFFAMPIVLLAWQSLNFLPPLMCRLILFVVLYFKMCVLVESV